MVSTFLLTKHSSTFQDPLNDFTGLCRSPAMFNYKQQSLTLYIQCDSTIHCKTFITSSKETVHITGLLHTFIYTWCSIHKRHVD